LGIINSNINNSEFKATRQVDSSWICANPNIKFTVTDGNCFGELKLYEKTVNVDLLFGPGHDSSMIIVDYDAVENNNLVLSADDILVRGKCKFSKNKCVVTVTESHIDSIKVDEKITFVRE